MLNISFSAAQQPSRPGPRSSSGSIHENNTITLRNLVRVTRTSGRNCYPYDPPSERRDHLIEIELYSNRPFGGGYVDYTLYIGDRRFTGQYRTTDADMRNLIFQLTPEEFNRLRTGDEVRVVRRGGAEAPMEDRPRRVWRFGRLDKSRLNQTPIQVVSDIWPGTPTSNSLRIRAASRRRGQVTQPIIEFHFCSSRNLAEGGMGIHLRIGARYFYRYRREGGSGYSIIFELTPEEFALLQDGDEIILAGPFRDISFGKLEKGKLEQE